MMATRCPFATWRPITANFTRGGRKEIRGFVPHVQVGTGSLWGFFNTPKPAGQGASADFWCSFTGDIEQYVDLADKAWAQGSTQHDGNPFFVSCEFEGDPSQPMTPQQIASGGRLIAWLRAEVRDFPLVVNDNPDGAGITPHHVFGGGHTCPGPGPREAQFPDLIAAANPQPQEVTETMLMIVKGDKGAEWWLTDYVTKRYISSPDEAVSLVNDVTIGGGKILHDNKGPFVRSQAFVNAIPVVK